MIKELFQYLSTPTAPEARAFGHLSESIALVEKEKRCQKSWLPHRTQCKKFITENLSVASHRRSVLVLGSGPLHEIPIEILSKTFDRVDLVDIVHLKSTKKNHQHFKNVHFFVHDVSELESTILKLKAPVNKEPMTFLDDDYGLIISANLMSQLAYHLENFLEKHSASKIHDEEMQKFCQQVTLDHYNYLKKFPSPVLLMTDIETQFCDRRDEVVGSQIPYLNFSLPKPIQTWWWSVAPIPEYSKELSLKMKVAAFILNY